MLGVRPSFYRDMHVSSKTLHRKKLFYTTINLQHNVENYLVSLISSWNQIKVFKRIKKYNSDSLF